MIVRGKYNEAFQPQAPFECGLVHDRTHAPGQAKIGNLDTAIENLGLERSKLSQARELLTGDGGSDFLHGAPPRPTQRRGRADTVERLPNTSKSDLGNGLQGTHADQAHQVCIRDVDRRWNIDEVMTVMSPDNRVTASNALNKAVGLGLLKRAGSGLYMVKKKTLR